MTSTCSASMYFTMASYLERKNLTHTRDVLDDHNTPSNRVLKNLFGIRVIDIVDP